MTQGEATLAETISTLLQADELWGRDLSRYSEKVADCAYGLLNGDLFKMIEG
jgi:tagaturonate reductase